MRAPWNERIPVWEQRIPQWETTLGAPVNRYTMQPPSRMGAFSPSASEMSQVSAAKSGNVTRDWSLLFSPGRMDALIRRPWPEYEPESSAAVGRRWAGTNLGRLYEHVPPAVDMPLTSPSMASSIPRE